MNEVDYRRRGGAARNTLWLNVVVTALCALLIRFHMRSYNVYSTAARDVKRITSVARSPVFNHFAQTLQVSSGAICGELCDVARAWCCSYSGKWTPVSISTVRLTD